MKKISLLSVIIVSTIFTVNAQQPKNNSIFKVYEPGYFQNSILKGIDDFEKKDEVAPPAKTFKVDVAGLDIPSSKDQFKSFWHNDPVSQGNTNTCWSYSSTSFFESEIYRTTKQKVKLSEMYTVYWEYVERAKAFVEKRGNSAFSEGSEGNAVTKIWKLYGIIPYDDFTGLKPGQVFQSHEKMFGEMSAYLKTVKETNAWNEEEVVATIKSIMKHYMGEPPTTITVGGKVMTPKEYLADVLKLNLDDYIDVLSYMQQPFWNKVEYEVPDNWWHNKDYYNVPLEDFMKVIKNAIKKGYTVCIGGDVSEAGFLAREANAAIVPAFDIPSDYIDDNARQFRFSNQTTTDDHGMHIVGYMEKDGKTWFLVKDSGSGSRTGGKELNKNFGYYFFHEDYVKLKMMDCCVHKDAFKDYLKKFTK